MGKEKIKSFLVFIFLGISILLITMTWVENIVEPDVSNPAFVRPTVQIIVDESAYDQWRTPTGEDEKQHKGNGNGGAHQATSTPTLPENDGKSP